MIFLGEQKEALEKYRSVMLCWMKIKLRGKFHANNNPGGHNCNSPTCNVCSANIKRKTTLDPRFVDCFSDNTLNLLISAKPTYLGLIQDHILRPAFLGRGLTENEFKQQSKMLFVTSGYEGYFYEKMNYRLAEWLDIHTCTYCNRQYIFVVRKSNGLKGIVPQFDHWFSKSDYPILALSFYNLIPSCGICNSSIKSDARLTLNDHLHPYVDIDISDTFKFSYLAISPTEYEIICRRSSIYNVKSRNTLAAMETKLLYKGHSNKELQDLIDLRYKYSDNYLNILLNKTFANLNITKSDRYRMVFGIEIDKENYHKRPFSKFKKDILDELMRSTSQNSP
ncbi:MAG: hypothetical protein CMH47_18555 [Muricauda sp.]|nr:hypothetical protein [Allomuricauda sp.]|tara:strand:+ start:7373 stop:8383 length:1011 start_codon:yes stop_codon:yes gene_type:complete